MHSDGEAEDVSRQDDEAGLATFGPKESQVYAQCSAEDREGVDFRLNGRKPCGVEECERECRDCPCHTWESIGYRERVVWLRVASSSERTKERHGEVEEQCAQGSEETAGEVDEKRDEGVTRGDGSGHARSERPGGVAGGMADFEACSGGDILRTVPKGCCGLGRQAVDGHGDDEYRQGCYVMTDAVCGASEVQDG